MRPGLVAGLRVSVVLSAQVLMTVISDKLSNSQTHETCSSGNERMFYDDAGFLSASATPQVLVSNFILKTFGGLSL